MAQLDADVAHVGRIPGPLPPTLVRSYWRTVAWRLARDPATLVAGALLSLIVLSALLAPWLAPYDPSAGSIRLRLAPTAARCPDAQMTATGTSASMASGSAWRSW